MDAIQLLLNAVTAVFIVTTMLSAGLGTTIDTLGKTFRNVALVALVLVANLVVVPLAGWGTAAVFGLSSSAFIALVLLASSPGAPFGVKLAMVQRGDVVATAGMQVLLAAVGSVTFPITANLILQAADVGGGIELDVGQLVLTVAVLQLIPFALGLLVRDRAPHLADEWLPVALKTSNLTFVAVLAGQFLGSWEQVVDLVGSLTLLAGLVFGAVAVVAGTLLAAGPGPTRTSMGTLAPMRNAGPVLAAVGIGFRNDPAIQGAVATELLMTFVVATAVAAFLAKRRPARPEHQEASERTSRSA
jgi:bile acid:Na+ symporter, BASS family